LNDRGMSKLGFVVTVESVIEKTLWRRACCWGTLA